MQCLERILAEVKPIYAALNGSVLMILSARFESVVTAGHIFVEPLDAPDYAELLRHGDVEPVRPIHGLEQLGYILDAESGDAAADFRQVEIQFGMLLGELQKTVYCLLYPLQRQPFHILIQYRDSVRLTLQALGLPHDGAEFFCREPCGAPGVVAVQIRAEDEDLAGLQLRDVFRCENSVKHFLSCFFEVC